MAKLQFSENMFKRAESKGKLTLGEYVVYGCCLYMASFFDTKEKTVFLRRLTRNNRGNDIEVSFEELFKRGNRITRKEAKERYSFIY